MGRSIAAPLQLGLQRGLQLAVLRIDGADAAEQLVVVGHLALALLGHVPAAQHVVEEGHHIGHAVGTAEGQDQQGVIGSSAHEGPELRLSGGWIQVSGLLRGDARLIRHGQGFQGSGFSVQVSDRPAPTNSR
jgi:hypothetical protein